MAKIPEKLGCEYYRGFLTRQGRAFYDRINAQLLRGEYSGKTTFSISNPETSASDCFAAYKAIRDDHPEFFYLGFQSEFTRRGRIGTLEYPILYVSEIIDRIRQQVRIKICRIVRGTADLSVFEREALVYERIAKNIAYTNSGDVRDHSIVGPVLTSEGVCEGQNALLLLCFRRIGIPCIKVYGRTNTNGWHCWTIAWINGIPVHCDVTWDGAKEDILRFDYLNLSDNQVGSDHYDFRGPRVPICPSEALTYYSHLGLVVHSYTELRTRLKKDSQRGISPILFHFGYHPSSGDYLSEVKKAISTEHIYGSYKLCYHPGLKNLAVLKG